MNQTLTQFTFKSGVSMQEVEATLVLSRLATQSLHGFDRVELEASCHVDHLQRTIAIEGFSDVGHTLALIFLGYCRREFGERSFDVRRSSGPSQSALSKNPIPTEISK